MKTANIIAVALLSIASSLNEINAEAASQYGSPGYVSGVNVNQQYSTSGFGRSNGQYVQQQSSSGYGTPGYVQQSSGQPGFGFSGVSSGFNSGSNFNNVNYQRPQQFQNSANYVSQSGYGAPTNYVQGNNANYVQQNAGGFSNGVNYNTNGNYQNQFNQYQQNQGGYSGAGNNFQGTNYQNNRPGFSSGFSGVSGNTGFATGGVSTGTNYVSGSSSGVSGGYAK